MPVSWTVAMSVLVGSAVLKSKRNLAAVDVYPITIFIHTALILYRLFVLITGSGFINPHSRFYTQFYLSPPKYSLFFSLLLP